jgi:hypothetical protein
MARILAAAVLTRAGARLAVTEQAERLMAAVGGDGHIHLGQAFFESGVKDTRRPHSRSADGATDTAAFAIGGIHFVLRVDDLEGGARGEQSRADPSTMTSLALIAAALATRVSAGAANGGSAGIKANCASARFDDANGWVANFEGPGCEAYGLPD